MTGPHAAATPGSDAAPPLDAVRRDAAPQAAVPRGSVHSYSVVLPPGWSRIPVADPGPVVQELLDEAFRDLPRDRYGPLRSEAEKALAVQVRRAREVGGLDLYLPVGGPRALPLAASFVVNHLPPTRGDGPPAFSGADPTVTPLVLAELLGDGDTDGGPAHGGAAAVRPVTVAGAPAVRRERLAGADERAPGGSGPSSDEPTLGLPTRRVDYVVPVPGEGGWLLLAFSVAEADLRAPAADGAAPGSGVRLTDLLVELFDAVVSTVRWRTVPGEDRARER